METNQVRTCKRNFYTIKEKLAIINYYNTYKSSGESIVSKNDVYIKFNIDHKSFNEWLKNEEAMHNIHDPNNKKTLHLGNHFFLLKKKKKNN